jgi:hypothetical protein
MIFPKRKKLLKKLLKLSKLKNKAEKIFHQYICKRDNFTCFTCGQPGNQASHFCHNRLDFDEMNLHCGCVRCNHFLSGNLGVYAINLDKRYGPGTAEALIARSHTQSNKFSREELNDIILDYKERILAMRVGERLGETVRDILDKAFIEDTKKNKENDIR